MDTNPIIIQQEFNSTRSEVWHAITEHHQMIQWFFEVIPDFKPEVGFKTKFNIKSTSRDFLHLWEITEVVPEEKIVYDWRYEDLAGQGKVTFLLSDTSNGCLLQLINEGLDSFPNHLPEFSRESCIAGWQYFINNRLLNYLTSKS